MIIVFVDSHDLAHQEFISERDIFNEDYYLTILERLRIKSKITTTTTIMGDD